MRKEQTKHKRKRGITMNYIYNNDRFDWDKEAHGKYSRTNYFLFKSISEFQKFLEKKKEISENFECFLNKIKKEEISLEAVGYWYSCPVSILKCFLH